MRRIKNTTITNIIGKREKKLKHWRESYCPFGDSAIKRKRSM